MMVTLTSEVPCPVCAYRFKAVRISDVRVNKRSLKESGVSLVMTGTRGAIGFPPPQGSCPECGERCPDSRSFTAGTWRLNPDDAAAVADCRDKKWPGGWRG